MGTLSEKELKALLQGGETTTVELKVAAPRAVDLAESCTPLCVSVRECVDAHCCIGCCIAAKHGTKQTSQAASHATWDISLW
jgi:hypothetical protein